MLKLYDFTEAPSPRRARMFLAEKELEYENIQVDLGNKVQMEASYRAINPRCTVPALVTDDGEIFTENAGISAYLENKHPTPSLLGSDALSQAKIAQWNWRCEFDGLSAVAEALRNKSPRMKGRAMTGVHDVEQIPELVERGRMRAGWFLDTLNEQLSSNQYVAGDVYSVADITATVTVDFAEWIKVFPNDSHTALKEWHGRMKLRDNYSA
ncbi:MAG: glutathione S-transferase [Litorimonas sp.]